MSKYEVPIPSAADLRDIFSGNDEDTSAADGLVYAALGFHNEDDYFNCARAAANLGALDELALAEARLQVIHYHDERKPGYKGYLADSEKIHDRLLGVDSILEGLSRERRQAFIDTMETEIRRLEAEQFAVDNGLSDLDKEY